MNKPHGDHYSIGGNVYSTRPFGHFLLSMKFEKGDFVITQLLF
jgi:hypothetical protein